jgi:hypothetical protein
MEPELIIKVGVALVAFVAWVIGKAATEGSRPAPVAATPPPVPRRVRRERKPVAPVATEPEAETVAPVPAPHLDATSLVVTRPARAHARGQFRGASALRQAIVAREVLGLPLSLRPPRF